MTLHTKDTHGTLLPNRYDHDESHESTSYDKKNAVNETCPISSSDTGDTYTNCDASCKETPETSDPAREGQIKEAVCFFTQAVD